MSPYDTADPKQAVHPEIDSLVDALSFRVARFNLLIERVGIAIFVEEFGLKLNEWRVMGLVRASAEVTHSDLSKTLVMDKGQVSRTVNGLIKRGLIEPKFSRTDKRVAYLQLTETGEALHADVIAVVRQENEVVVDCFTPEECEEFLRLLNKLTDRAVSRAEGRGF